MNKTVFGYSVVGSVILLFFVSIVVLFASVIWLLRGDWLYGLELLFFAFLSMAVGFFGLNQLKEAVKDRDMRIGCGFKLQPKKKRERKKK